MQSPATLPDFECLIAEDTISLVMQKPMLDKLTSFQTLSTFSSLL